MGTFTITKNNRLFWLGRYTERVYQGVVIVRTILDDALDDKSIDLEDYCTRIGIFESFASTEDFCKRYAFDRELQGSIVNSADSMLGNGMVLRELLGTPTLSYLEMTLSALEAASTSHSSAIQFQWALDDIMAFRGSYAELVDEEAVRNTIKSGASVERVSTLLRFDADEHSLTKELYRLINRLNKTNLSYDLGKLGCIQTYLSKKEACPDRSQLLNSVETLFLI